MVFVPSLIVLTRLVFQDHETLLGLKVISAQDDILEKEKSTKGKRLASRGRNGESRLSIYSK